MGARVGLIVAIVVATVVSIGPPATAHAPHDDIFDIAVSPAFETDDTMFTISRGLLLRSTDAGATWVRSVKGLDNLGQFESVAYAGGSSSRVYAVSRDAAFVSTDGGQGWQRVRTTASTGRDLRLLATSPASTTAAIVSGVLGGTSITEDSGATWRSLGAPGGTPTAVAFGPDSAEVIYVGDATGTLHVSTDGAQTWTSHALAATGAVTSITFSPSFAADGLVLLGTSDAGVVRWDATTSVATVSSDGLTDLRVTSIAFSADYPTDDTIFTSTWDIGTFVSEDAGATWAPATIGLQTDLQATLPAYDDRPNFGRIVTARRGPGDPVVYVGSFTGVFSSQDQAASWQAVETLSGSAIVGLSFSPTYATDGKVAIATYLNGAFTSTDRGDTFNPSNLGMAQASLWHTGVDRFARLHGITQSTAYQGRTWMFSGTPSTIVRSPDGGATWKTVSAPGYAGATADPETARVPFILTSPTFSTDRTVFLADGGNGDLYRSTDEGANFQKISRIPSRNHCLQAAPSFATDRRLLACTGLGVYVSTDLGLTWTATRSIGASITSLAVAIGPTGAETWLAGTANGLYRSTDRGQAWTAVTLPVSATGTRQVQSVVASPPAAGVTPTVLVSVKGKGLLRSTNGGTTFTSTGTALADAGEQLDVFPFKPTAPPIVFSPAFATDRTIIASSYDRVLRSRDGGLTWQRLTFPRAEHGSVFPVIPVAPGIGTVTRGDRTATVPFTLPRDSGTPLLRLDATCTSSDGGSTRAASGLVSPLTVASLTNGKTYTCRVTATNALGTSPPSAVSNTFVPAAAPSSPATVTAVPGNRQVTVSWTPPVSNGGSPVTGYVITPGIGYYPLPSITVDASTLSRTVTGLTNGVGYHFSVKAINAVGTSVARGSGQVTPAPTVPMAPTILTAAASGSGSATIEWLPPASDGGSPVTSYVITPYAGFYPFPAVVVGGTTTSTTITGLPAGVTFRFRMVAVNAVGSSLLSGVSNPVIPA